MVRGTGCRANEILIEYACECMNYLMPWESDSGQEVVATAGKGRRRVADSKSGQVELWAIGESGGRMRKVHRDA